MLASRFSNTYVKGSNNSLVTRFMPKDQCIWYYIVEWQWKQN